MTADLRASGAQGLKNGVRELASRVKAVGDVLVGTDVTGGPEIATDGQTPASRDPHLTAGTPPVGAPDR